MYYIPTPETEELLELENDPIYQSVMGDFEEPQEIDFPDTSFVLLELL